MEILSDFSLQAFVQTKGTSGHPSSITPKKFKVGDTVRRLNPETMQPYPGEYTVLAVKWWGTLRLYEVIAGVWVNGKFLTEVV